eukprot:6813935-Heterocapsa_arctica.AAC.1
MKEGPDIEDEHEKNKLGESKVKFEPLIKFMKEVFDDMKFEFFTKLMKEVLNETERIIKAQAIGDNYTTFYMMLKKRMEINLKHFIVNELRKMVATNKSDEI